MTRSRQLTARAAACAALALSAAACGSSGGSSLAGPSPVASTATIQGTVNSAGASTSSWRTSSSSGAGLRVSVVGTSLSTQTDGSGGFTLRDVPAGSVTLRFEGPGIDARLTLSGLIAGQTLQIQVQVSGATAAVTGRPSPSPSPSPSPGAGEVEFRGIVDSVGASSLVVSGRNVLVSAGTEIKRGDAHITLAQVKVGEAAKVEGAGLPDGSVQAREIKLGEDASEDDDEFEFKGSISAITPPSLTVAGKSVLTNAQTEIRRHNQTIPLTDLLVGEQVEVKGRILADGTRLATRIKTDDDDDDDNGGSGDDDDDDDDDNGGHGGDDDDDDDGGGNSGPGGGDLV